MNKAMLVVMDGLGDRPIRELGGLTPLEGPIPPISTPWPPGASPAS